MKKVYANALLSDDKILFWYVGSECDSHTDFYKDFYYSGIKFSEYEKTHKLKLVKMGFIDPTDDLEYNHLIFKVFAKEFYKQYPISEDSKGQKPY